MSVMQEWRRWVIAEANRREWYFYDANNRCCIEFGRGVLFGEDLPFPRAISNVNFGPSVEISWDEAKKIAMGESNRVYLS